MMIAREEDGVARRRSLVTVMNRHNIEILVEIIARHPIEVGEQHAVTVIDIVQIGIVHGIDEVAEGVLLNVRLNASGVVDHIKLDMVLLCRQPP